MYRRMLCITNSPAAVSPQRFRTADARANRLDASLTTARARIADLEPRLADCTVYVVWLSRYATRRTA